MSFENKSVESMTPEEKRVEELKESIRALEEQEKIKKADIAKVEDVSLKLAEFHEMLMGLEDSVASKKKESDSLDRELVVKKDKVQEEENKISSLLLKAEELVKSTAGLSDKAYRMEQEHEKKSAEQMALVSEKVETIKWAEETLAKLSDRISELKLIVAEKEGSLSEVEKKEKEVSLSLKAKEAQLAEAIKKFVSVSEESESLANANEALASSLEAQHSQAKAKTEKECSEMIKSIEEREALVLQKESDFLEKQSVQDEREQFLARREAKLDEDRKKLSDFKSSLELIHGKPISHVKI